MASSAPKLKSSKVSKQVVSDPIILREGPHVRLTFAPKLVDDPEHPNAKIEGTFVYQRKLKGDRWQNQREYLSMVQAGEVRQLPISHTELRTLLDRLVPLYKLYDSSNGIAAAAPASEAHLPQTVDVAPTDTAHIETLDQSFLTKLLNWLATEQGQNTAAWLATEEPAHLPKLTAALGLATLKVAHDHWLKNRANSSEAFWQQTLEERNFVLSQLFAYPVLAFGSKTYVGGKQFSNKGGKYPDLILSAPSTNSLLVLEIKTPITRLLDKEYRGGVFPFSGELQGAITQVLRYRQALMRDFTSLTSESENRPTLGEPRCIVIAGSSNELTTIAHRECFELQRERLNGVSVITYDELFGKLNDLVQLLEAYPPHKLTQ
jgi:hypothetical protein